MGLRDRLSRLERAIAAAGTPDTLVIIHGGIRSPTPQQIAEARARVDDINMAGQGRGRVHVVGGGLLCGGHATTTKLNLTWMDTVGARDQRYVVETNEFVVQRCLLMTTDPGDLLLDPTCGSGTTAYVAEQWGRRWITIDTSRVALALARARIMGARYPFYLLPIPAKARSRKRRLLAPRPRRSWRGGTFVTASSMSACRTSRSNPSPTTPRSMSSGTSGGRSWNPCATR
jgi:DNA methylase